MFRQLKFNSSIGIPRLVDVKQFQEYHVQCSFVSIYISSFVRNIFNALSILPLQKWGSAFVPTKVLMVFHHFLLYWYIASPYPHSRGTFSTYLGINSFKSLHDNAIHKIDSNPETVIVLCWWKSLLLFSKLYRKWLFILATHIVHVF